MPTTGFVVLTDVGILNTWLLRSLQCHVIGSVIPAEWTRTSAALEVLELGLLLDDIGLQRKSDHVARKTPDNPSQSPF